MGFLRAVTAILFVTLAGVANADVWSNNGIPPKLANALKGVGLNSAGEWSSCRSGGNRDGVVNQVLGDGWRHFVYVVCIDDVIMINNGYAYNANRLRARMRTVGAQIRRMAARYPHAGFVVSMKSRTPIGGWDDNKILTTYLYQAFENSAQVRQNYHRMWADAAQELRNIDSATLAFNIMNEPEYHNRGRGALGEWSEAMLGSIDAIRAVSPDRVILVEGIHKSKLGRGKSAGRLMRKLPRDRIVYTFHYYEPHEFTHQRSGGGRSFTSGIARDVRSHLGQASRFSRSQRVPVMISEFGVWGPFVQGGSLASGVTAEDRAAYASAVWEATVPRGIGITWWGLHDHNTPYQRLTYTGNKQQPRLVRDDLLLRALRLR